MKIALARINQSIGKLEENTQKILSFANEAKKQNVDLIVFPEFAVSGGYCRDLFNIRDFLISNYKSLELITSQTPLHTICGTIGMDKLEQNKINAVAYFHNDNMKMIASKYYPDDSDDIKFFKATGFSNVMKIADRNVVAVLADTTENIIKNIEKVSYLGADIILILSCSSYYSGKKEEIKQILVNSAKEYSIDIAYLNMLGGSDGYVFEGLSMYVSKDGNFKAIGNLFEEGLTIFDTDGENVEDTKVNREKEMYDALVLGLKDYMLKNGFKKCVLGVSGGIDSALTAAIACDAVGPENVLGVLMPSKYTSDESNSSGLELCNNLGMPSKIIPIEKMFNCFIEELTPSFEGKKKDLTEENLQARIRSNILMALSNKFGYFVLCTCNKSEDAVGYSTLYGDASGGYAPVGDLLKKDVYALSKYRNSVSKVIPDFIIDRPPTAELRENQKDSDSLPEYDILDDVLEKILDKKMSYPEILESGVSKEVLDRVWKLLSTSEYKRRQSPINIKVTKTTFSRDIVYPLSAGYVWKPIEKKQ